MTKSPELLEQAVRWMELTESNIPPNEDDLLMTDMEWLEAVYLYKWVRDFKMYYHLRPSGTV